MNEQGFGVNNDNQNELYKTYITNSPKAIPSRKAIKQKVTRIRSNLNQTTNQISNMDQQNDFIKKENNLQENIAHANNEETNVFEDSNIVGLRSFKRLMPALSEHPNMRPNLNQRSNTPNNVRTTRLNPLSHHSSANMHQKYVDSNYPSSTKHNSKNRDNMDLYDMPYKNIKEMEAVNSLRGFVEDVVKTEPIMFSEMLRNEKFKN